MKIIESRVNADLGDYWLNQVTTQYLEEFGEFPTGIIMASTQLPWDMTFDLRVTMLFGLPDDFWMIYGKKGIIYSPGA